MSTVIGAPRERVWEALTNPAEMVRWDRRMLSCTERPAGGGCLAEGDVMCCRYRVGTVPVDQRIRVLTATPGSRFELDVSVGLFRFRETSLLTDESRTQTRLSLRLAAPNVMPIVGGIIDRFDVRKMASDRVDERLRVLRLWCESPPTADASSGAWAP